jgi:Zn-dependent peptidase ImmA (M78 family)
MSVKSVADTTFLVLGVVRVSVIYRVRMSDGVAARTDGVDIWVDDRLNPIQERCAIEHEKTHIEMGHSTVQTEAIEFAVRYETAKRLLPDENLREDGPRCQGSTLAQVARNLGVTRQVLMDRAATLTDSQAEQVGCLTCRLCPIVEARYPARQLVGV